MADWQNRFFPPLKRIIDSIPVERRRSLAVISLLIAASVSALLFWAFRPQYRTLYSDLSLEDSGQIVDLLSEENIPYRLEQEGHRIAVPSDKVYETRLKLASQSLPREHATGWELFDQTNLGVTDFVQKLNYRRGLEGEIARTIMQLDPVEAVRVHLVIPDESLFRENQKEPMASVTLRLKRGAKLNSPQVEGITFLVASAVEGLAPEHVTVVDSRGMILSQPIESNPVMRLSSSQLEIQKQVEQNLVAKGQDLLDRRFGYGRSAIQVTAELDFQQREQTRELYDADNPAVRSEETTVSTSMGADTSSSRNENSVTNYELNLTRERTINPIGVVKRISTAVMVDGKYTPTTNAANGKPGREFSPLPPAELREVENTIRAALGIKAERGDELTVVSVPFQEIDLLGEEQLPATNFGDIISKYGPKVVSVLAVIIMLLMVGNFLRKVQIAPLPTRLAPAVAPQLGPGAERMQEALEAGIPLENEMTAEGRSAERLHDQVVKYVNEKPETAARLVRSWLIETEYGKRIT